MNYELGVKILEEYRLTLKIAAYLLEYPNSDWWAEFAEYRDAAAQIPTPQAREVFEDLFSYAEELGAKEYETRYVRAFDFSQNTNLYLTTQDRTDFGKQAQEMHEYKTLFLDNGFDLKNELPDYLPALLELAATVPASNAKKIFAAIKGKLELLRDDSSRVKLRRRF